MSIESPPFQGIYQGRPVLLTGHTGFKGAWLALWLEKLGARVFGYSLDPPSRPNLFEALGLECRLDHVHGDVTDFEALAKAFARSEPEVVFHLAAQALVRPSWREPRETFLTNAAGTVNVIEAARRCPTVRSVVIVTSDKCYAPPDPSRPLEEGDRLGGVDPYSASKAMAELAAASYARVIAARTGRKDCAGRIGLATARAGNVIGGGDFGEDRLVPDLVRALEAGRPLRLRNPRHCRPWQFVLDPLAGYLTLGAGLLEDPHRFGGAWNFGPPAGRAWTVVDLAKRLVKAFGRDGHPLEIEDSADPGAPETEVLLLDGSKAERKLGWRPVCSMEEILEETARGYAVLAGEGSAAGRVAVYLDQIARFEDRAAARNLSWASN